MAKTPKDEDGAQSRRFLETANELEAAGELNPPVAGDLFETAFSRMVPARDSVRPHFAAAPSRAEDDQRPRLARRARPQLGERDLASDPDDLADAAEVEDGGRISYTASLISQGKHRFYTLSMPSDVLAETCIVEPRNESPLEGFQRALDERRAREIAAYIDSGFGTIPSSIVLSAQPVAELEYRRRTRTLNFMKTERSFLILDGQHRVYGFKLATSNLRVPVVIYNGLNRAEECRLFMDINTKQRPVPNELLLDIKRLAETESDGEALLRDVFDGFDKDPASPLFGLMSPAERRKGKVSRVTFNAALKPIADSFSGADPSYVYEVLSGYLHACLSSLRELDLEALITNPTIFRALMLLFPTVAERVADRHPNEFTVGHFAEIISPLFQRMRKADLENPGTSYVHLHELFSKALRTGFTIGRGPGA